MYDSPVYTFSGSDLGLLWIAPFAGLLLSIAFLPLILPHIWHRHFGKIAALWVALFVVPGMLTYGSAPVLHSMAHTLIHEYVPFIILLLALFTIGGGVRVKGHLPASPATNAGILALGTVLASIMGTTGAAMLLIRPIIMSNKDRAHRVHVIVFFIFLVANVGGSLTPLGDPPLFLGFLNGVDFFWPLQHMLAPMLIVSAILLILFYGLDHVMFRREAATPRPADVSTISVEGKVNILLLVGVMGAVILSGVWKPGWHYTLLGVDIKLQNITRDWLLLLLTYLSLRLTTAESRKLNGFSWFPMIEVGKLFAAIFITMIPALLILKAGQEGAMAPLISMLTNTAGDPVNASYFWLTGVLSSFLDNAPTYLVFFNTAGGHADHLMHMLPTTLLAISAGAVFFGAATYIGNAPNFMVKAIAEQRGIPMPSFFGYMLWSCGVLLPVYALVTLLFFL